MTKKLSNSQFNMPSHQMKLYLIKAIIQSGREIRCENRKCGSYKNIEFHHTKYAPKDTVSVKDIKLECSKCHRNSKTPLSSLSTVFEKGKRFCVGYNFKFAY